MFLGKFIKGNLSVVSDMALYYTQYKHIYNLDEGLAWEKIKWLLPWHFVFGFSGTFCSEFVSV